MTLVQFGLDAGPEGATLTDGNSGSNTGSGSPVTFTAATKAHGAFGATAATVAANANAFRRWGMSAPATSWSFSMVVTLPASAPANAITFAGFPRDNGSHRAQIRVETTGRIQFLGRAGTSFHTLAEAANVTWGSKYRITLVVAGGSATASTVTGKVYREATPGAGAWTTQVGTTLTASGFDTGTEQVVGVDLGIASSSVAPVSIGFDDVQMEDGRTTEIPDFVLPNLAPVVTAGAAQTVTAGAPVTLAFTATDGDGTIASRSTTFDYPTTGAPSITGGTGGTPSFTAGAAGTRYVVRHTATDNLGSTGSATTEVFVPAAGSANLTPEPGNGTGAAGWTIVGGSATQGAALADASDTTYVESTELTSTPVARRWRWIPGSPKASAVITPRFSTSEGAAAATVRLYEGTTLRQTWSGITVTTTPTPATCTVSGATLAAISDWKNLFVEVEGVLP